jgi:hypothetical protein
MSLMQSKFVRACPRCARILFTTKTGELPEHLPPAPAPVGIGPHGPAYAPLPLPNVPFCRDPEGSMP